MNIYIYIIKGTVELSMFNKTEVHKDRTRAPRGLYKLFVFEDIVAFQPLGSRGHYLGDTPELERQNASRVIQLWWFQHTGQFARYIKESAMSIGSEKDVVHLDTLSMVIVKAECANEVRGCEGCMAELEDGEVRDRRRIGSLMRLFFEKYYD